MGAKKKLVKKTKAVVVVKQPKRALTLQKSPLEEKGLLYMLQRTPKEHIYSRPAKGGGTWEYVTGVYVKKVLNYVFGWGWSFEIKQHGIEGKLVWVLGRLTVLHPKTGQPWVVKEQFGRADLKTKRDSTEALDFGNDLKAAATDALKKCASELGIASDIYGKNEFKEAGIKEVPNDVNAPATPPAPVAEAEEVKTYREKLNTILEKNSFATHAEKVAAINHIVGSDVQALDEITEQQAQIIVAQIMKKAAKK